MAARRSTSLAQLAAADAHTNTCGSAVRLNHGLGQKKSRVYRLSRKTWEWPLRAENIFAAGYLACAIIALASRTRTNSAAAASAPFWLRIAIVCGLFAVLRFVDAQMAVGSAVRDFSRSAGLTDWKSPGPYLMLVAIAAFGFALAGLFLLRRRGLHPSINVAAFAIVVLALLAIAHSLSLYVTGAFLQARVGPVTVSRIIEAALLLLLGSSSAWFLADSKDGSGPPLQH